MSVMDAETLFRRYWRPQGQAVTKYAQISQVIIQAIQNGDLLPDEKLPTETEFAQATPFSLGTIQRALQLLVTKGFIERHQGVGTFVAKPGRLDALHCRFLAEGGESVLPVYGHVTSRREISEPGRWTETLGEHLENVLRIERILNIGNEFHVLSRFYLDPLRLGALKDIPLEELDGTNFKVLLDREFSLVIDHFDETMGFETFDGAVCEALDCKAGTTGVIMSIAARSRERAALYYQQLFIPPNGRRMLLSRNAP